MMSHPHRLIALLLAACPLVHAYDVPGFTPDHTVTYKQTVNSSGGAVTLNLHVFNPEGHQATDSRPAIIFFFGGGWVSGSPTQFHPHCEYLAGRGMVAISAEYRVKNLHGTTPQECVKDGKSAIRYLRENAAALGIDPNRIAAGGGSAGGHVAAATGTLTAYEEAGENLAISSRPNALVLFNPVYDNGPDGYGHNTVQAYWQDISPLHNLNASAPPTAVFLGTNDIYIPVATARNYKSLMEAEGVRSDLHLYQNQPHGFFNYEVPNDGSGPWYGYRDTVFKMDEFLVSLDYLADPHDAADPVTGWATLSGDAGFSTGSEATASPVTTDADGDAIAANIDPLSLTDGDFIRLTGSVAVNAPLTGGDFRIGLFDGDDPVAPGDGSGYVGIWAEAPATADTHIVAGNGTGMDHPFETATGTILGPIPAASATVPAATPVAFTLMIARNGGNLDITARFTDGASYDQEQNLINQSVANFDCNSVAFLMGDNLNATQAAFSDIGVTTGRVLADPIVEPPPPPPSGTAGPITYVDAVEGSAGNTFKTGSTLADTSWMIVDISATDNDQWSKRTTVGGNGGTLLQAMPNGSPASIPGLTTRISGLADGDYEIHAFYWDQITNNTQNWVLSAGLTADSLTTYSSPGHPAVSEATTEGVANAADLTFVEPAPSLASSDGLRQLFGVQLGIVTVVGGEPVDVHLGMLINGSSSSTRVWYDGVGFARIGSSANTYADWIDSFNVGTLTAFDDDADGDGIKNGLENFFGTDPDVPNPAGMSTVAVDAASASFTFTHPQNPTPAEDLVATYQWSDNLVDFHDNGASNGMGTTVTFETQPDTPNPNTTTVVATAAAPTQPDRLFFSIKTHLVTP